MGRRTWPGRGDIYAPCPCVCASSFLLVILRRAASNPKWAPATFCSPHGTVAAAARQRQERARERRHRRLHALSWLLQLRRRLRDQPTRPVKPAGGLGARCVPVARPHVLGKQRRPPYFRDPPADEESFNCSLCTPDDYCFNNSTTRRPCPCPIPASPALTASARHGIRTPKPPAHAPARPMTDARTQSAALGLNIPCS